MPNLFSALEITLSASLIAGLASGAAGRKFLSVSLNYFQLESFFLVFSSLLSVFLFSISSLCVGEKLGQLRT